MAEKRYTQAEANSLLPYLAPTLVELREKFEAAAQIRQAVATAAASNGGSHDRDDWSRTLARVSELLDRIQEWEIQVRDISQGLADFPAVIDGQEAWLCWRLGEPEVAYWHPTDTGFANRRPL
ncbi:MAG TPA: DUF2203 domain-containing protein [Actinomycetota bacterium]|nr:DUF2203 domain-containing protein [Actinomycetota bacterium]